MGTLVVKVLHPLGHAGSSPDAPRADPLISPDSGPDDRAGRRGSAYTTAMDRSGDDRFEALAVRRDPMCVVDPLRTVSIGSANRCVQPRR
jgi:hypothetical protein